MAAKMSHAKALEHIEQQVKELTKNPVQFLKPQPEKSADLRKLLKLMYNVTTDNDFTNSGNMEILPELVIDMMDEEQIWQQLEMRNNIVLPQFIAKASKMLAMPKKKFEIPVAANEAEEQSEGSELEDHDDDEISNPTGDEEDDDDGDDDDDEEHHKKSKKGKKTKTQKKRIRPSIVDDKFFKLDELREFLDVEDAKELKKQKGVTNEEDELEEVDLFNGTWDDESEDENNCNYKDFFESGDSNGEEEGAERDEHGEQFGDEEDNDHDGSASENDDEFETKQDKKGHNNGYQSASTTDDSDSDAPSEQQEKPKSSHEQRQKRLEQRIHDYEDELLGKKSWQLKGEIQAPHRPQNSLLAEVLEFESNVRPAPVITEETTRRLEEIIRQRIKDQAWDDVERKLRTVPTPQEYRNQIVLNQEKSKESLAQVYEKEYNREMAKLDPNAQSNEADEEPKEYEPLRQAMNQLFYKLDLLFQFDFTPKPIAPEIKIITNTPALAREEVLPVAISDAQLLAPEEVYRGPKHELVGKSERTRTDKNRERRKKKQKQRAVNKVIEVRDAQRQKMGIPLTKKAESAKLLKKITKHRNVEKITTTKDAAAPLKSSKAFFSKLQETTSAASSAKLGKKKKLSADTVSAKKLKL